MGPNRANQGAILPRFRGFPSRERPFSQRRSGPDPIPPKLGPAMRESAPGARAGDKTSRRAFNRGTCVPRVIAGVVGGTEAGPDGRTALVAAPPRGANSARPGLLCPRGAPGARPVRAAAAGGSVLVPGEPVGTKSVGRDPAGLRPSPRNGGWKTGKIRPLILRPPRAAKAQRRCLALLRPLPLCSPSGGRGLRVSTAPCTARGARARSSPGAARRERAEASSERNTGTALIVTGAAAARGFSPRPETAPSAESDPVMATVFPGARSEPGSLRKEEGRAAPGAGRERSAAVAARVSKRRSGERCGALGPSPCPPGERDRQQPNRGHLRGTWALFPGLPRR